jgi:hypothetical protein
VADDIGRAIVITSDPDQSAVFSIGVPPDRSQTPEMPLSQSLKVQVVENVAVDDEHAGMLDGPIDELLDQFGLADIAAKMKVTDDEAIVAVVRPSADCRVRRIHERIRKLEESLVRLTSEDSSKSSPQKPR